MVTQQEARDRKRSVKIRNGHRRGSVMVTGQQEKARNGHTTRSKGRQSSHHTTTGSIKIRNDHRKGSVTVTPQVFVLFCLPWNSAQLPPFAGGLASFVSFAGASASVEHPGLEHLVHVSWVRPPHYPPICNDWATQCSLHFVHRWFAPCVWCWSPSAPRHHTRAELSAFQLPIPVLTKHTKPPTMWSAASAGWRSWRPRGSPSPPRLWKALQDQALGCAPRPSCCLQQPYLDDRCGC